MTPLRNLAEAGEHVFLQSPSCDALAFTSKFLPISCLALLWGKGRPIEKEERGK
jgi:hypothetical protein